MEPTAPYYALYSYKVMSSDRFDLLGNSLAILTGIASPQWAANLLAWIEAECEAMRGQRRTCRGFAALSCFLTFCPIMWIGCHDTSAITGLETITTGVCGHLFVDSTLRRA